MLSALLVTISIVGELLLTEAATSTTSPETTVTVTTTSPETVTTTSPETVTSTDPDSTTTATTAETTTLAPCGDDTTTVCYNGATCYVDPDDNTDRCLCLPGYVGDDCAVGIFAYLSCT